MSLFLFDWLSSYENKSTAWVLQPHQLIAFKLMANILYGVFNINGQFQITAWKTGRSKMQHY